MQDPGTRDFSRGGSLCQLWPRRRPPPVWNRLSWDNARLPRPPEQFTWRRVESAGHEPSSRPELQAETIGFCKSRPRSEQEAAPRQHQHVAEDRQGRTPPPRRKARVWEGH